MDIDKLLQRISLLEEKNKLLKDRVKQAERFLDCFRNMGFLNRLVFAVFGWNWKIKKENKP